MKILVVGGAGYIGSHMVRLLGEHSCEVITLDDLSTGNRESVTFGKFIQGNCGNRIILDKILSKGIDAVMHFASSIQVDESLQNPNKYYQNNVGNTLVLLDAMCFYGVKNFIFSSTAATFGEPKYIPIDEKHLQEPISPYGRSKLIVEQLLSDYDNAYGIKSVCLRYFNAAGAHPHGDLGEQHHPETHLIPLLLQVASGEKTWLSIYGDDYETPDGTCVRDYVHVQDICLAHWLALKSIMNDGGSKSYNLGNGQGYSIQEVINMAEKITKQKIKTNIVSRRSGDPAKLIADASLIRKDLGWSPVYDLEDIVNHAWQWVNNPTKKY
jgi:UDP-glucose 4-epimerase